MEKLPRGGSPTGYSVSKRMICLVKVASLCMK